jgi:hypothetical protein
MIKEKLTYSPMKGKPGHCFMAQVWDSDGFDIVSINSRYGARKSTEYARLFASSPDLYEALKTVVDNIDHWLKTGEPANKKTSKKIYNKARKALLKADGGKEK